MAAMPLLPEILLACAGLIFLMIGVFMGDRAAKPLAYAVAATLVAVLRHRLDDARRPCVRRPVHLRQTGHLR